MSSVQTDDNVVDLFRQFAHLADDDFKGPTLFA
jgi:hypothetical protein